MRYVHALGPMILSARSRVNLESRYGILEFPLHIAANTLPSTVIEAVIFFRSKTIRAPFFSSSVISSDPPRSQIYNFETTEPFRCNSSVNIEFDLNLSWFRAVNLVILFCSAYLKSYKHSHSFIARCLVRPSMTTEGVESI